MNIIPIAFAFDEKLIRPACVCLTSLLENANADSFYNVYIIHSDRISFEGSELKSIERGYNNCKINYISVGDAFQSSYEVRGVTIATYYRLLLPDLIKDCDKIIYSDVDIIFRLDLYDLYNIDLTEKYIAATRDLGLNYLDKSHIKNMPQLEFGEYIQAGLVVMNLKKMRDDKLVSRFIEHASNRYTYQDQDILNICCKNNITYLPPIYNVNDCAYLVLKDFTAVCDVYSKEECAEALIKGNIHYSGKKPWKEDCVSLDVWWEYYRRSPVFDFEYYFNFFFGKTFYLDTLSLWKRIKVLLRYFVFGRSKL